ncbi:MAG: LamG-like jellyroll fold domain-containing protein, partial [Bacteroidota bacterium]|nr:LamG-like jellyroll fold domain-containing protein [Bacteroidota bacterium]
MKKYILSISLILFSFFTTKAQNYALTFDGIDDIVSVPGLSATTSYTVEAWVFVPSIPNTGGWRTIIEFGNDSPYFGIQTPNSLLGNAVGVSAPSAFPTNIWTHVACSYDNGTNLQRLYINGTQVSTATGAPNRIGVGMGIGFNIGDFSFLGMIDEVRIWNIARTPTEIQNTRFNTLVGNETGLVGYYDFNQTSGTILPDLATGNGAQNGILSNFGVSSWVASSAPVPLNNALDFDGVNDEVNVGNVTQLNITPNFTAEAWVYNRLNTVVDGDFINTIFSKKLGGAALGWSLFINEYGTTNGKLVFEGSNGINCFSTNTNVVPLNQWTHIAVSVNNGVPSMFINGNPIASTILGGTFQISTSSTNFRIGNFEGATFYNNGIIDEARIWNVSRTPSQIQASMNSQLAGNEANLVAYYNFNQGIAGGTNTGLTTLTGKTTPPNNGTLSGFGLIGATSNWVSGVVYPPSSLVGTISSFAGGVIPIGIIGADFNGDGKIDLITANAGGTGLSLLTGTGTGSFGVKVDLTSSAGSQVDVADINGDGKLDIVLGGNGSNLITIFTNTGTGGFGASYTYSPAGSYDVAFGDFNNDGKQDIVSSNATGANVSVLLNNGNGTFSAPTYYGTVGVNYGVTVGDFNADGNLDIAAAYFSGSGQVSVLLGNGSGGFSTKVDYTTDASPFGIQNADLNGDGKPDIVTANYGSANMSVLINNGNGTFAAPVNYGGVSINPNDLSFADMNGDGSLDIILGTRTNTAGGNIFIFTNSGVGAFSLATKLSAQTRVFSTFSADFNGDGKPDIAASDADATNTVAIFLNTSANNQAPSFVSITNPLSVCGVNGNITANFTGRFLSYQWYRDGISIAGANTISLTSAISGSYYVVASNIAGSASSSVTTITACNNALQLNGNGATGPYVNVTSNSNDFNLGSNFTLEAWINPVNSGNGNYTIMSKGNGNGTLDNGYIFQVQGGILMFYNTASTPYWFSSGYTIPFNTWTHVAVTYDANLLRFFVNGNVITTIGTSLNLNPGSNDFYIGNQGYSCACNRFYGQIDEARVWNVARTPNDIQANLYRTIQGNLLGLVAAYNFNHGIAGANNAGVTTLVDQAGGNHNGTLNSFILNGSTSNWVGSITTVTGAYQFGAPFISIPPALTVCSGVSTTYSVTTTGQGTFTYQWLRNGIVIAGQTTATLTLTSNLTTSTGTFQVLATSIYGSSTSAGMSLAVGCNNALDFDGVNDFLAVPHSTSLNATNEITIDFWVYRRGNTGNDQSYVDKVTTINNTNYRPISDNSRNLIFYNGASASGTSNSPLPNNVWTHLAYVINGTDFRVYINGSLSFTGVVGLGATNAGNLLIGKDFNGRNVLGAIDELRIWNKALSASDIAQNYNKIAIGTEQGLMAYYNFNQGVSGGNNSSITTIIDKSINGNHATTVSGFSFLQGSSISNFTTSGALVSGTFSYLTPTITGITFSQTVCSGVTIPLSVTVSGSGLVYQWCKDGVNISGATSSTLTLSGITFTSAGVYSVLITSLGGNLTSGGISLSVGCNNALDFDGVNDGINVGPSASLNNLATSQFTFESWINIPNSATAQSIIRKTGDYNFFIFNQKLYIEIWPNGIGNATWRQYIGTQNITLGVWNHVAVSYNNNVAEFYINGVKETISTFSPGSNGNVENLGIGYSSIYSNFILGQLDEVKIWNKALSQGDIQTNRFKNLSNTVPGLVLYYDFNLGIPSGNNSSFTSLIDKSGNGNTGNLIGFNLSGSTSNYVTANTTTITAPFVKYIPGAFTPVYTLSPLTTFGGSSIIGNPGGLTVLNDGRIIVTSNSKNALYLFSQNGTSFTFLSSIGGTGSGLGQFNTPGSVAISSLGLIAVADASNHRIQTLSLNGNNFVPINTFQDSFSYPFGVTFGPDGRMFVSNDQMHNIKVYSVNGSNFTFSSQFGSLGSGSTNFNSPQGIHVGVDNRIYITDYGNQRLQILTISGNTISQITQFGVTGSSGTASNQLFNPYDVEVGPSGNVYIVSYSANSIRLITVNGVSTGYIGQLGTTSGSALNQFLNPIGVSLSNDEKMVYVADYSNSRISVWGTCDTQPEIVTQPQSQTICGSSLSQVTVSAVGVGLNYLWSNGSTSATLSTSVSGIYTLTVNGLCGYTYSNPITITSVNCALNFDGTNDYVSLGDIIPFRFDGTKPYTVEMWVRPTSLSGSNVLFSKFDNGVTGAYEILMASPNLLRSKRNVSPFDLNSSIAITTNNWYHVATSYNGSILSLYLNGSLVGSNTFGSVANINTPVLIGADFNSGTPANFFVGDMDEIRVWNSAIPQSQIANNMNRKPLGTENGLLAYYDFDQGTAGGNNSTIINVLDRSVNTYTGLLTNFAKNGASSNFINSGVSIAGSYISNPTTITGLSSNQSICSGTPITLSVTALGTALTYQWFKNSVSITGASLSTISLLGVSSSLGTYFVVVTGTIGSATSTGINVSSTDLVPPIAIAQNLSLTFTGTTLSVSGAQLNNGSTDNCGITSITCTRVGGVGNTNFLNGVFSGGSTTILDFRANSPASNYSSLGGTCSSSYQPEGTFCDEGAGLNSQTLSNKTTNASGATWFSGGASGVGILVVDMSQVRNLSSFAVFQMFADGKVTHFRAYAHPNTSSAPAWNDGAWSALFSEGVVGAGNLSGNNVTLPTIFNFATVSTRYLKFEFRNDGRYGNPSYIEVRAVKAFGPSITPCTFGCADAGTSAPVTLNVYDGGGNVSTAAGIVSISSQEIDLVGNGNPIPYIQTVTSSVNGTHFGTINPLSGSRTFVYTITNSGTLPLSITGFSLSGPDVSDFAIVTALGSTFIGPSGSSNFAIRFDPSSSGYKEAYLTINSTDCNEPVYVTTLAGIGNETEIVLDFDGVNDYLTMPSNNVGAPLNQVTIETWINVPTISGYGIGFYDILRSNSGTPLLFAFQNDGTILSFGAGLSVYAELDVNINKSDYENQWVHVAITYDGSTKKMYRNGVLIGSAAATGNISASSIFYVGAADASVNEALKGKMDEFRIWNRALTQTEIQNYMVCNPVVSTSGLYARYDFNQGDAGQLNTGLTSVIDRSGKGNNGTANNFALNGASSNWVSGGIVNTSCVNVADINIVGNGQNIAAGSSLTSTVNGTSFGNVNLGSSITNTYSIESKGFTNLNINAIQISGTNASEFLLVSNAASPILPGNSSNFSIQFIPSGGGTRSAVVSILSNDPNESPYLFTISGTSSQAAGAINFALNGNVIEVNDATSLDPTNLTLECWVKFTKRAGYSFFFSKHNRDTWNEGYGFATNYDGKKFYFFTDGYYRGVVQSTTDIVEGQWYHVAGTFDGNQAKIYVNGVLEGTTNYTFALPNTTNILRIGGIGYSYYSLNGSVDEARVWNVVKTQSEIQASMDCQIPSTATGLVLNHQFNNGLVGANNAGLINSADASGLGNNGTLVGFTLNGNASNWAEAYIKEQCIPRPDINVKGNGINILTGSTNVSLVDFTNLGSSVTGTSITKTYTIENLGTATLNISTVQIIGLNTSDFIITANPASSVIAGGSTTFSVQFINTIVGLREAIVRIINDDGNEGDYRFDIAGRGLVPGFNLVGNGEFTDNGSSLPSTTNGTNFTSTIVGLPITQTYTIYNYGNSILGISLVTIIGSGDFTISVPPASTILPGQSTTFTVTFTPTSPTQQNAIVQIVNTQGVFEFAITGAGNIGSALAMNGNFQNQSVRIPYNPKMNISGTITIETWLYLNRLGDNGGFMNILMKGDYGYGLAVGDDSRLEWWNQYAGGAGPNSNDPMLEKTWTHVAVTVNTITGLTKFYINGVLNSTTNNAVINNNIQDLMLGVQGTGCFCNFFDGALDELRIWNVERSQSQIQANMNTQIPGTVPGLVAYYQFNQGVPSGNNSAITRLVDAGPNGFDGTLQNFVLNGSLSNWINGQINTITPQVAISGSGVFVTKSNAPIASNSTYFGTQAVGGIIPKTFTLQNVGNTTLGVNYVTIVGANPQDFAVASSPSATIALGGTSNFTINFVPTVIGVRNAVVRIASNDVNDPFYDFNVSALGLNPGFNVKGNGNYVSDGATIPTTFNGTDLEGASLGVLKTQTFTIENLGITPLNISLVSISGSNEFSVVSNPAATVNASGNTTFTLGFTPLSLGQKFASVRIVNSEGTFIFTISGTGQISSALAFDGNQSVLIPDNNSLDFTNQYTFETWINLSAYQYGTIVSKYDDDANNRAWFVNFGESGNNKRLTVLQSLGNFSNFVFFHTNFYADLNTWYHIAVVYDGTLGSNQLKLYVNGALQDQTNCTVNLEANNPANVYLGGYDASGNGLNSGANSRFLNGKMDEVRFWNRARTSGEIAANYNSTFNTSVSGLVAYYKFNQGIINGNNQAVNTLVDESGNKIDGTLNNFALTQNSASNWASGAIDGLASQVKVSGNSNIIAINSAPSATNNTDFGGIALGGSAIKTFNISNIGNTLLGISSVNISGPNAADFTVVSNPITSLSVAGTINFDINFTPLSGGVRNAIVNVLTNDPDDAVYTFSITGSVSVPGGALNFDGVDDYIITSDNFLQVNDEFTVEAYVNTPNTISNQIIVSKSNGSGAITFEMNIVDGVLSGTVYDINNVMYSVTGGNVSANSWQHIAMTWKQGGNFTLYVNGTPTQSITASVDPARGGISNLIVGASSLGVFGPDRFIGNMDELHFWNRELSQSEIMSRLSCQINTALVPGLILNYDFNQGAAGGNNSGISYVINRTGQVIYDGVILNGFALTGLGSNFVQGNSSLTPGCPVNSNVTYAVLNQSGGALPSESTIVGTALGTDFGTTTMNNPVSRLFTISTSGIGDIIFTISSSGSFKTNPPFVDNSDYVVTVAGGSMFVFTAQLNSNAEICNVTKTIRIQSNSIVQPLDYTFDVGGFVEWNTYPLSISTTSICGTGTTTISLSGTQFVNGIGVHYYLRDAVTHANISGPFTGSGSAISIQSPLLTTTTSFEIAATYPSFCVKVFPQIFTVTVNSSPNVTATVSSSQVCFGNTVTFSGIGAQNYSWSNGIINNQSYSPSLSGAYSVVGTDLNGCQNSAVVNLTVNSLPILTVSGTGLICIGQSASVTATGASSYVWSNSSTTSIINYSPVTTNTLTVIGTNSFGCSSNQIFTTTVVSNPTVTGVALQNPICIGQSTTLVGNGAVTYSWSGGVTDGIGFNPSVSGLYSVTGSIGSGCQGVGFVNITVNSLPNIGANVSPSTICQGQSATFSGSGGVSYLWTGGVINGVASYPTVSGLYTVTGTDVNGCSNTNQKNIIVNAAPNIQILGNNQACPGVGAALTAIGGDTYLWNIGSVTSTINYPISIPSTFSVTGTNTLTGCSAVATKSVGLVPSYEILSIPSNIIYGSTQSIFISTLAGQTYQLMSGSVPQGLSFDGSNGLISGTASVVGLSSFNVKITNGACTSTIGLSLTVDKSPLFVGAIDTIIYQYSNIPSQLRVTVSGIAPWDNANISRFGVTTATSAILGSYPISVSASGSALSNYILNPQPATLQIRSLTGIAIAGRSISKQYGLPIPVLQGLYFVDGVSVSGVSLSGVNIVTINGVTETLTTSFSTNAVTNSGVGTANLVINPSSVNITNRYKYNLTTIGGAQMNIDPLRLRVTAQDKVWLDGQPAPTLTGIISSALTINGVSGVVPGDSIYITYDYDDGTDTLKANYTNPYVVVPEARGSALRNYSLLMSTGIVKRLIGVTITATNFTKEYGNANPNYLKAYVVSGVPTSVASAINYNNQLSSNLSTDLPVGTYSIVPIYGGGIDFNRYFPITIAGTLTVNPAGLTIVAANFSKTQGQPDPAYSAQIFGLKNGETINVTIDDQGADNTSPVGDYVLSPIPSGSALANYTLTTFAGKLTIGAAPGQLSVQANSFTRTYGDPNPVLTGIVTGLVAPDDVSPIYSTTATQNSPVGTYPITLQLTGPDVGKYIITTSAGTLTITQAPLTVTSESVVNEFGQTKPNFKRHLIGALFNDSLFMDYNTYTVPITPTIPDAGNYSVVPVLTGTVLNNYSIVTINSSFTVNKKGLT